MNKGHIKCSSPYWYNSFRWFDLWFHGLFPDVHFWRCLLSLCRLYFLVHGVSLDNRQKDFHHHQAEPHHRELQFDFSITAILEINGDTWPENWLIKLPTKTPKKVPLSFTLNLWGRSCRGRLVQMEVESPNLSYLSSKEDYFPLYAVNSSQLTGVE